MALRVLLADESMPMKKVMQLALQDFAVEVKAVQAGTDVLEVARAFKPDIIFVDVILPKKGGYDVSAELKGDKTLNSTPVVLMWSSLLGLDPAGYQRSKANTELEKPFDVETLRTVVKEMVPKTQTNRLAHFLQFPADFVEPIQQEGAKKRDTNVGTDPAGSVIPTPPALSMHPETNPAASSNWNMDNFEPLPDVMNHFKEEVEDEPVKFAKLGGTKTNVQSVPAKDEADPWAHQDLNRFKLDIPAEDVEKDEISIVFDMNEPEPKGDDFLLKRSELTRDFPAEATEDAMEHTQHQIEPVGQVKDIDGGMISQFDHNEDEGAGLTLTLEDTPHETPTPASPPPQMDADELERVIRAQSKDVIEAVVQRVVPEIAREMIKKELERILSESTR